MIIKMIQNLGNRMEKIQETFNKDLEELKSKQTVMNNTPLNNPCAKEKKTRKYFELNENKNTTYQNHWFQDSGTYMIFIINHNN